MGKKKGYCNVDEIISMCDELEDCLGKAPEKCLPFIQDKTCMERFRNLIKEVESYPVEMGALTQSIESWIEKIKKEILKIDQSCSESERKKVINQLFEDSPVIYLNNHSMQHIKAVMNKAKEILVNCHDINLEYYELFILLCAIVVHDIGNVHGRKGHEREVARILSDPQFVHLLPDSVERKVISSIAQAHGGVSKETGKDTIACLLEERVLHGIHVRERMLAAILRFSDELADDSSRADYDALKLGIIPTASLIHHKYSVALHTVCIRKNPINHTFSVHLSYSFEIKDARIPIEKVCIKQYLLDEIYERTMKMERERRYCMRYLRMYLPLEEICVDIEIFNPEDPFWKHEIKYELKEEGYPEFNCESIQKINETLPTGEKLAEQLQGEEAYHV